MPSPRFVPIVLAAALTGCVTLGPTPATTAISPVSAGRSSVEVQAGFVPGYFLSSATVEEPKGQPIGQLAAVVEPGPEMGIPGFFIGGRSVGPGEDNQVEPLLGYRRTRGDLSGLVVGFATRGNATAGGARYEAIRAGGEVAFDYRVVGEGRWVEPHLVASVAVTGLSADGAYCVDESGYGMQCPEAGQPPAPRVDATLSGIYPAATAGIALHGVAHRDSWFHGLRAVVLLSAGTMPRLVDGQQEEARGFVAVGAALSVGLGSAR